MAIDVDPDLFWRDGYCLIRRMFPLDEVESLRAQVYKNLEKWRARGLVSAQGQHTTIKGDILSKENVQDVILDDRVLGLARRILGAPPVYFGDSSVHIGPGGKGWHRDNRTPDRTDFSGLDWQGRYGIVRFGIYLQDHATYGGGLGIRVRSHVRARNPLIRFGNDVLPHPLRRRLAHLYGRPINVPSRAGDVVVWTLRTVHSGGAVRLRMVPNLRVPPKIEEWIPDWMQRAPVEERVSLFFSLAVAGEHLDRYIDYLRTRDYMVETWACSAVSDEVRQRARAKGLGLLRPTEDTSPK